MKSGSCRQIQCLINFIFFFSDVVAECVDELTQHYSIRTMRCTAAF
ncbi:hypothetical protein FLA_4232 [Filimonas lacunae]|nr:hypothetical protein FLA_4232 [Filimonas lacunae]